MFSPKIYIVQQYDRDGSPGTVLGVKLTFAAAHQLAKAHAPAKVLYGEADKTAQPNVSDHVTNQPPCN